MTSSTGDELRAAVSARRDLGPDFEDAIVESFLDKMGKEVDRRVDERLAAEKPRSKGAAEKPRSKGAIEHDRLADGQLLALAIVSLVMGTGATSALALGGVAAQVFLIVWVGIVAVNLAFALSRRR
jgi:hypothetical protein